MPQEMTQFSLLAAISTAMLLSHLTPAAISHPENAAPSPSVASTLQSWIDQNMKEYNERKGNLARGFNRVNLDSQLVAAEEGGVKVITVRKDGSGDFRTVTDAVNSIPDGNTKRMVIKIGGGRYWEKITVNRTKNFVMFYGDPNNMPKIVYNGTAAQFGTVYSATVAVESDYFIAVNIAFVNTAPMPDGKIVGAQAVAMRISGDKAAFYNCKFIGYQDTLCDDRGKHFFKDFFIRGTVDFIFGNGKSLYLNTTIVSVAKDVGVITAHARENDGDDSGYTFAFCSITGIEKNTTYLGRPWKERARVVFAHTYMGSVINSGGWSSGSNPNREKAYYGEYQCSGPGSAYSARAKHAKMLTGQEAKAFLSLTYIHGSNWLLPPPQV